MPTAPPRICSTCGVAGCSGHIRAPWTVTHGHPRLTGRTLQRARARLFEQSPLCVVCEAQNRVTVATIRDHIVPIAEGGTEDPSNIQPLCESCHRAKSDRESRRGRRRQSA